MDNVDGQFVQGLIEKVNIANISVEIPGKQRRALIIA